MAIVYGEHEEMLFSASDAWIYFYKIDYVSSFSFVSAIFPQCMTQTTK